MWELTEALAHYKQMDAPSDQTALVSFLKEVQQEHQGIPAYLLPRIAEDLQVKETYLLAVIKRIPSLRLQNTHCLELCAGPNCSRRGKLAEYVEKTYGTKPEKFTLKYMPCMRMCGKGPNIKWDGQLYNEADEALLRKLIEG